MVHFHLHSHSTTAILLHLHVAILCYPATRPTCTYQDSETRTFPLPLLFLSLHTLLTLVVIKLSICAYSQPHLVPTARVNRNVRADPPARVNRTCAPVHLRAAPSPPGPHRLIFPSTCSRCPLLLRFPLDPLSAASSTSPRRLRKNRMEHSMSSSTPLTQTSSVLPLPPS